MKVLFERGKNFSFIFQSDFNKKIFKERFVRFERRFNHVLVFYSGIYERVYVRISLKVWKLDIEIN